MLMKNLTQNQRWALATPSLKSRMADVRARHSAATPVFVTEVMLEKKDQDATAELRHFLESSNLHDYTDQPNGARQHGTSILADYAYVHGDGSIRLDAVQVSLYRANGRGDERYNVTWPKSAPVNVGEVLAFTISLGSTLVILNISHNLDDGVESDSLWERLLALASLAGNGQVPPGLGKVDAGVSEIVNGVKTNKSRQGYLRDAVFRAAIERYSVQRAIEMYRDLNATEIHERGKPYDIDVFLNGERVDVEVKGSTQSVDAVFVTKNEVAHARESGALNLSSWTISNLRIEPMANG
jgi:hypothetical protein